MSHSLAKVHIQYGLRTKYRKWLLIGGAREKLRRHVVEYAAQNNIHLETRREKPMNRFFALLFLIVVPTAEAVGYGFLLSPKS